MSRLILILVIAMPAICLGQPTVPPPPTPGQWHVTICSVPIARNCLEASGINTGACASAGNSCDAMGNCTADFGVRLDPNIPGGETMEYFQTRPAETGETGSYMWKFLKGDVCAILETCECEPPGGDPATPRKCRAAANQDDDLRPWNWEYGGNYTCAGQ